jgi:ribonuclease HII
MAGLQLCMNNDVIEVGIDEAGRGCWAGPVVAAAVILDDSILSFSNAQAIRDSKKLSKAKRAALCDFIKENAIEWSVGFSSVQDIDTLNILNATMKAMHTALGGLTTPFEHVAVDGNYFKPFNGVPYTCVVGGDDKYMNIAAASIIAKTTRDEFMSGLSKQELFQSYNWESNAGYGTRDHIEALKTHGVTEHHRRSYKPILELLHSV